MTQIKDIFITADVEQIYRAITTLHKIYPPEEHNKIAMAYLKEHIKAGRRHEIEAAKMYVEKYMPDFQKELEKLLALS